MRVNVTIPVFNEELALRQNIASLSAFLAHCASLEWEIVIANNGSTDGTLDIALRLAEEFSIVSVVNLSEKGRGRALKSAWSRSAADVFSYMDADLSSDLAAFPRLIEAVTERGFDLAVGSRLLQPGLTKRSLKRELISRCYNSLTRLVLGTRFSDAQCGFKAITRKAACHLLPLTKDTGWFFDTELLVLAELHNYRIFDLPVRWKENPRSSVRLVTTAMADIRGILRLRREWGRALRDHHSNAKR